MKNHIKILLLALIVLVAVPVTATHQQVIKKIRKLAEIEKSQEILRIASSVGVDVRKVKIKFEHRGEVVKLNGTVFSSNELARLLLAVESVGQFKDMRNFVKVVPLKADDGIVVREIDYVHAKHSDDMSCPVCESGEKCDALYKQWKDLNKRINKYIVRRYNKSAVVYKRSAKSLINQFIAVQEKLDASLCFEPKMTK
jgi:hypothetical protein